VSVSVPVNTQVVPGGLSACIAVTRINYQNQPCSGPNQTYPAPPVRGLDGSKTLTAFVYLGCAGRMLQPSVSLGCKGRAVQGKTPSVELAADVPGAWFRSMGAQTCRQPKGLRGDAGNDAHDATSESTLETDIA
jgi:hypothetical protein